MKAFKGLLSAADAWHFRASTVTFKRLDFFEAARLEGPFKEEEIHAALGELNGDKAPGPYGFTMAF